MKKALVVIDMQKCFCNEYTKYLPEKIKNEIETGVYGLIVFTKFVNHEKSNFHAHGYKKCMDVNENELCNEIAEAAKKHRIFEKDAFSAFKADGLVEFLKENDVTEVCLCGTDTDACVMASAYDAFDNGFRVKVLYELCASCNGNEFHQNAITLLKRNLGFKNQ